MKQPYFTQEVTWLIHTLCNCNFDKSVKKYRKLDSVLITQWKLCLIKSNSVSSKKYIRAPCHDDGKWDTFSPIVDLLGKCDKTWKTFQWTATDLKSKTYEVVECIAATLYYSLRKNELLTRMSSKVPTSFKVEYIKRKWIEHRLNIKHFWYDMKANFPFSLSLTSTRQVLNMPIYCLGLRF